MRFNQYDKSCDKCSSPNAHVCRGCSSARYCSQECQVDAWLLHKKQCKWDGNPRFVCRGLAHNVGCIAQLMWEDGSQALTPFNIINGVVELVGFDWHSHMSPKQLERLEQLKRELPPRERLILAHSGKTRPMRGEDGRRGKSEIGHFDVFRSSVAHPVEHGDAALRMSVALTTLAGGPGMGQDTPHEEVD